MQELSKLQIRAKVLSVISEVKSVQYKNKEELERLSLLLDEIEDKVALFDIFIKEYIKLNEEDYTFSACILKNTVPVDIITEKSLEILKSTLSDEYKYKVVQLLRITGGDYNYSDLPKYFDNPDEVMDLETKRLLDSAVFNPEAMLDFLDFVSAVSEKDKSLLLKSLALDYEGDVLANIVYPVLYSDFSDEFILQAIDILSESKSSLAIAPFEYLIDISNNEKVINACKLGLKKLKLAGATKEKADEYFKNITKTSLPSECLVTLPDGSGKQALLVTRKHDNGKFSLIAVVISDLIGIVDCFGFFSISEEEVIKIINKFYKSEGQFVASNEYIKSRIDFAHNLTIKNKGTFPYEYICWSPLINISNALEFNISDYVNENCIIQEISKNYVADLMTQDYTLRWFLTPLDNEVINQITDKIYSLDKLDISLINNIVRENLEKVFDEINMNIWFDRFYNLIFILIQNQKQKIANDFYTIIKNEEFLELFKQIILQRSIFNYFVTQHENVKDSFFTTNIFKKKNTENKYDIKKIKEIIYLLKRGWIDINK